ncbi:MAG: hypothetical protein EXQ56_04170 [Acidobacteria bacterium]|nr:hypothetical protein [Acidobacteriota bacterium]
MASEDQFHLLRFDQFEIDLRTRELRQQGRLIKLQDMPVRLLILLATRAGELVTREEIEQEIWGDDHFVDFDHGINTAMRKIREAGGESPESPRFIETLPRKGYRFIAIVERGMAERAATEPVMPAIVALTPAVAEPADVVPRAESPTVANIQPLPPVADGDPGFALPVGPARGLFLLTQVGYLVMYCTTLYKLDDAGRVLDNFLNTPSSTALPVIIAVAVCGVAVRLYLLTSVGLRHPDAGTKYRQMFPMLFLLDAFWAASPLLLVEKIGIGLALASVAALAYLPFSQRILMRSIYRDRSHG